MPSDNTITIARCPLESIDWAWPLAKDHIAKALEYAGHRYTLDYVFDIVDCGKAQLWLVADGFSVVAACVTQIYKYPAKILLNVLFLGGSGLSNFLPSLLDTLKRFARENDCVGIEMCGRPGWLRVLDKHGFADSGSRVMELEL